MALLLVVLEIPAIIVGILLARLGRAPGRVPYGPLAHEVLMNKSVYLLLGGLAIGWIAGPDGVAPLQFAFVDGFKGALAFFLLEMGIVAAQRLTDLRRVGFFLVIFGILMPLISGALGALAGRLAGLSPGGTAVLATMAASSSYYCGPGRHAHCRARGQSDFVFDRLARHYLPLQLDPRHPDLLRNGAPGAPLLKPAPPLFPALPRVTPAFTIVPGTA